MKKDFIINIILLLVLFLMLFAIDVLRDIDDTDKSRWDRSGLSLYTDHGTGCQYISIQSGFFGKGVLIPRVDKIGMQICGRKK